MNKWKMNLTNYHSHSSYCDGKAPMEEFVKSAIVAGFTSYGISSHAPLPFETRWTLSVERVAEYLEELSFLKAKYASEIELYAGMEIDFLNEEQNPASDYFQQLPLDYRIGSVHLIYTDQGEVIDTDTKPDLFRLLVDTHFGGNLQCMVERYYDASMRMVETGGFDFVGHADKIASNAECYCPGVTQEGWYGQRREEFFRLIAAKSLMMEVNTKAFVQKGCFFPGRDCFDMIRELGIPVMVNSDAHLPELVNAGREEALRLLKDHGFRTVCELHAGRWEEVAIC